MRRLKRNEKQFLGLLVVPLLAVIAATIALSGAGESGAAGAVSALGTVGVITVNLLYVVLVDSRQRWPEAKAVERLRRVLTFTR